MDLKAAKNMKVREMACNDVQKVADSLNVNLTVSMPFMSLLVTGFDWFNSHHFPRRMDALLWLENLRHKTGDISLILALGFWSSWFWWNECTGCILQCRRGTCWCFYHATTAKSLLPYRCARIHGPVLQHYPDALYRRNVRITCESS